MHQLNRVFFHIFRQLLPNISMVDLPYNIFHKIETVYYYFFFHTFHSSEIWLVSLHHCQQNILNCHYHLQVHLNRLNLYSTPVHPHYSKNKFHQMIKSLLLLFHSWVLVFLILSTSGSEEEVVTTNASLFSGSEANSNSR